MKRLARAALLTSALARRRQELRSHDSTRRPACPKPSRTWLRPTKPQSGDKVTASFGPSSALAKQLKAGAPADLFFSADAAQVEGLVAANVVRAAGRGRAALQPARGVVPANAATQPADAADVARLQRLALADPAAVPAGVYAKQWLESRAPGRKRSRTSFRLLDVRAALAAVESENADAGIVYKTDAAVSQRVQVAFEVPREEGPSIVYPLALVTAAPSPAAARAFAFFASSRRTRDLRAPRLHRAARAEVSGGRLGGRRLHAEDRGAQHAASILPLGIAIGFCLARCRGPGRGLIETVLALPLVLPPTAVGVALLHLLSRGTALGGLLERHGLGVVFTWKAVRVAAIVMSLPLLVRSARTAFEERRPAAAGAGAHLGRRPGRRFLPRHPAARLARPAGRRRAGVRARARRVRRDHRARRQHSRAARRRWRSPSSRPTRSATTTAP